MMLLVNLVGPGHEGKMISLSLSLSLSLNKTTCLYILPFTGLNNINFAML